MKHMEKLLWWLITGKKEASTELKLLKSLMKSHVMPIN